MKTDSSAKVDDRRMVSGRAPRCVGYYAALLTNGVRTIINYHPWSSCEDTNAMACIDTSEIAAWSRIPGQRYAAP